MLPDLTTPRLLLRAATGGDVDALWRLLTDPQVRRYLCDDRILTRAEVQELLAESMTHWPAGMGLWLLSDGGHECLGCVGLHPVSRGIVDHAPGLEGEIEPTIALTPACWGRGYATEALLAAVSYAVETLGLERLVAVVDAPNEASHRLMIRVGFTPTGGTATGPCYPLRTYRLTRAEFAAGDAARPGA
jgi:[ribosomal protein S5]-alanine N-acetyltransferase